MKKMMLMAAMVASITAYAGEKNDTTVIENAKKVTIIASDTEQHILVRGKTGNSTYLYENSIMLKDSAYSKSVKKVDIENKSWDFDLGVGYPIATNVPNGMSFAPFKSYEWILGVRYKYTPKQALQSYSVGLWCDWRKYTLDTNKMFDKDANNVIGLYDYPTNADDKRSGIYIFSLSVPFLFTQKLSQKGDWKLTAGPVVNFNLYGRIDNEFSLGDYENNIKIKNVDYRPVTVDIMCMAQYRHVGIYCKYSPMSILKKNSANGVENPQFRSISVGVFF